MKFFYKKFLTFVLVLGLLFSSTHFAHAQAFQTGGSYQAGANGTANIQGVGAVLAGCLAQFLATLIGNQASENLGGAISLEVRVSDAGTRSTNKWQAVKEQCLDQTVRVITLKVIDKITFTTVEWINNGFQFNDGKGWIDNLSRSLDDLAKGEIESIKGTIFAYPANYPFGKVVLESLLGAVQRSFAANARYSLNQVVLHGQGEQFWGNFTVGGWAGYTALFNPSNNPFGNRFLVANEIARRTRGTQVSAAIRLREEVIASGGFIGDKTCLVTGTGQPVETGPEHEYLPFDHPFHIEPGGPIPQAVVDDLSNTPNLTAEDIEEITQNLRLRSVCKQWKTRTPGKIAAETLTDALGSPLRQLELADELNENIGLIFDALLLQLVNQGIESLTGDDPNTNVLAAQVQGLNPGSASTQVTATDFLDGAPGTLGFIQIQQDYLTQAQASLALVTQVISKINELDYCVPGPNPRWFIDSSTAFENALLSVPPAPDPNTADEYYRDRILSLAGFEINPTGNVDDHTEFISYMQFVFNNYVNAILNRYSPDQAPPSSRPQLVGLYNDLSTYQSEQTQLIQAINDLNDLIPDLQSILTNLQNTQGPAQQPYLQQLQQILNSGVNSFSEQDLLDLQARAVVYVDQINLAGVLIQSCINETTSGNYQQDRRFRIAHPGQPFTNPNPNLPNADTSFLLNPTLTFGNGIDVTSFGVSLQSGSGLGAFQNTLQYAY